MTKSDIELDFSMSLKVKYNMSLKVKYNGLNLMVHKFLLMSNRNHTSDSHPLAVISTLNAPIIVIGSKYPITHDPTPIPVHSHSHTIATARHYQIESLHSGVIGNIPAKNEVY